MNKEKVCLRIVCMNIEMIWRRIVRQALFYISSDFSLVYDTEAFRPRTTNDT